MSAILPEAKTIDSGQVILSGVYFFRNAGGELRGPINSDMAGIGLECVTDLSGHHMIWQQRVRFANGFHYR